MKVEAVPFTDFQHGDIRVTAGRSFLIEQSIAGDLERAGLVYIRSARVVPVKAAPVMAADAGKAPAAGQDQASSASPAAPASLSTTLHLPKRGRPRKDAVQ